MGVGIEGDDYAGVTKPLAYGLGIDALLQHQGHVRVPGVMEADTLEARPFGQPGPNVADGGG